MAEQAKQKRLGRGLAVLLGDTEFDPDSQDAPEPKMPSSAQELPIEFLQPNPYQPRRQFDDVEINELTSSIREKGVLQPIIVRPVADAADSFQIVAGERRWRASQKAGLHKVPVLVKNLTDQETFELSLIENVQRSDLNPIEEARAYQALIDEFDHTQEKLAQVVGKSRSHIANLLRLLGLPENLQRLLFEGQLSAGHARALIGLENLEAVAKMVVDEGLNVRQTEALVRDLKKGGKDESQKPRPVPVEKDADTLALEDNLSTTIGLKVLIDSKPGSEGGSVRIAYKSLEQLDEICRLLSAGS